MGTRKKNVDYGYPALSCQNEYHFSDFDTVVGIRAFHRVHNLSIDVEFF